MSPRVSIWMEACGKRRGATASLKAWKEFVRACYSTDAPLRTWFHLMRRCFSSSASFKMVRVSEQVLDSCDLAKKLKKLRTRKLNNFCRAYIAEVRWKWKASFRYKKLK